MNLNPIGEIKDIFTNINNWLTYADVKIGVLLTFDVTVLFGIIQYQKYFGNLFRVDIILLIISIIILLVSVVPLIYDLPRLHKILSFRFMKKNAISKNCIYFMNIATRSEDEFVNLIKQRYQFIELDDLAKDYLSEIYENSKIVSIKNSFFRLAIIPTFAAIFLIIFILICL